MLSCVEKLHRNDVVIEPIPPARQLLVALIQQTQQQLLPPHNSGILSGLSGQLLFLWQAAKMFPESVDEPLFNQQLLLLQQYGVRQQDIRSFGYGISGVGWFFEYILADDDYQADFNAGTDTLLLHYLQQLPAEADIEFVIGLSGLAVYLARRARYGQAKQATTLLLAAIAERAVFLQPDQCSWPTPVGSAYRLQKDTTDLEYNLGLAHGMPAVLAALLGLLPHLPDQTQARQLLQAGCNWLLQQQQAVTTFGSYFANAADRPTCSRLGWCYGDLTLALTLFRAGELLEEPRYTELARQMSLHCSRRREQEGMVFDAGLCHGYAGLVLIFGLLSQYDKAPELVAARQYWLHKLLNEYQLHGLVALHKQVERADELTAQEEQGLLSGYAGIGLCLLAAEGQNSDWVDLLLLG